jgi:hypothetical protein
MGEWRVQISVRVSQDFRREFEAWAEKERRKPSNLGSELLVWSFEQLKVAGSLTRLLNYKLGKPKCEK